MRRQRRLGLAALPLLLLSPFARAGVQLVVDGVDDTLKAPVIAGVPALMLTALIAFQLLAAGYALTLADGAAEAGAMAMAAGRSPYSSA